MQFDFIKGLSVFVLLFISPITYSGGVSPYLSVNLSPLLENEVERLTAISGMSNLSRPYSLASILNHMNKVRESHPQLYRRLKKALKPYIRAHSITQLSASARVSQDHHVTANQRGNYTDSHFNVSFRSQLKINNWLGVFIGGDLTQYKDHQLDSEIQASGSMIAIGTDWAQIDIGYKDIWLSPFKGSAQLLSTQAKTMPSISLSNNLQLETFGVKWNYNMFLAQMSRQQVQFKPGEFSNKDKPLLSGMHLNFQLSDRVSIGASRVFQFGGGERSLSENKLVKAFFDLSGTDNEAAVEQGSGNQIMALSSKINFNGSLPFSLTVELAGEETSSTKAWQLGNTALTAGLYFPYLFTDNLSFNYEYSSWQIDGYSNDVYQDGYVNDGVVLGHWAMQPQRELKTATPGNTHFLQMYWQFNSNDIFSTTLRTAHLQSTTQVNYSDAWELKLDYSTSWHSHIVTMGIYLGQDSFGENFSQLNLSWEL